MASPSTGASLREVSKQQLLRKVRSHEIAIAEMQSLPNTRGVYQKNGNIFFRKDTKITIAAEQEQLESTKAQLKKLDEA